MIDRGAVRARIAALLAEIVGEDMAAEGNAAPVTLDQEAVGRISRIDAMQVQAMGIHPAWAAAASDTFHEV